jgi:glycosyltransferase involved in cell wall biosynthesis
MSSVLFFDPGCPAPYSRQTLEESALGGTEASVVRIAEAIDAQVMQHNRTAAEGRYLPDGAASRADRRIGADPERLVVLRDPRAVARLGERFPRARPYLWLHDLVRPGSKRGRRLEAEAPTLARLGATIVCVSDFQRGQAQGVLDRAGVAERVRTITIYNPIDDALVPDDARFDPDKLVFFSSPNKGLALALDAFRAVRRELPGMRLCIGSPGYKSPRRAGIAAVGDRSDGVCWLGPLPHAQILAEVRTALAVFYPNFVLPETFGLVLAEARAVGTPVLTHDCGAAAEVLCDRAQTLPVVPAVRRYDRLARALPAVLRPHIAEWAARGRLFEPYVERIRAWRDGGRPQTGPDPRFRLTAVAQRWRDLLDDRLA